MFWLKNTISMDILNEIYIMVSMYKFVVLPFGDEKAVQDYMNELWAENYIHWKKSSKNWEKLNA